MIKVASSLVLLVALAVPVSAQQSGSVPTVPGITSDAANAKGDRRDSASNTAEERREARLDLMYGRLANAKTKRRADRIASYIVRRLSQSGSPTVDLLMERSATAIKERRFADALDLLDGVVRLQPDFAEGWNRRATVHFMMEHYGQAVADIEQVLQREPRHWGALVGFAMILVTLERKAEAVEVMDRALAVHPFLEDTRTRRDRYAAEIAGLDI
ncbi:tetratricopeptide repeat protein [Acuticoccus sp. M5D2P5]|uniref:tetratricopeptide repeat protein n=1 Tax=Acuticoccus kalidii TaxID=2910977 RepID=UPI001F44F66F|nr:tetratricopeptide repeat protein [Acuticoccus kalidii]MCF3933930.1 tetratricopeptide repeat protein [Acuticoccus kalidii]